jgi:hypothetical protein
MAFTVETGAIVSDANAYITVEFFQSWHTDRGVDVSDFETPQMQAAIIKATDYVDKRFGVKFVGTKRDKDQSLQWPRSNAWDNQDDYIDSDTVPTPLKRAVAEYAFLAIKLNELLPTPAPSFNKVNLTTGETEVSQGGLLQRKKEKVGPIEEETWYNQEQWRLVLSGRASGAYSDLSSLVNLPEYPVADEWLKPIVKAGNNVRLSRG